jgi:hypothetical protein
MEGMVKGDTLKLMGGRDKTIRKKLVSSQLKNMLIFYAFQFYLVFVRTRGFRIGLCRDKDSRVTYGSKVHPITCHEGAERNRAIALTIVNIGAGWKWVVNAKPRPL